MTPGADDHEHFHHDRDDSEAESDAAFNELYQRHFDDLARLAKRLVDSDASAEEVVQEAFVKFHTARHRPVAGKELPYLRSIVLNQARSMLRHRRVARRWRPDASLTSPSGEADCMLRLESESVQIALTTLPLRQRQVLTYRHLVGLSEQETAAALNITVGSVKTHSSRGRNSLRDHISVA